MPLLGRHDADISGQPQPVTLDPGFDDLSILDIMCFGAPLKEPYKRWKKSPDEITHWDVFDQSRYMTDEELDVWIRKKRHKVMYKDAAKID